MLLMLLILTSLSEACLFLVASDSYLLSLFNELVFNVLFILCMCI